MQCACCCSEVNFQPNIFTLISTNYKRKVCVPCFSVIQACVNDDEDFPRGGANPLTPLEIREARNEAEKDILFGVFLITLFLEHVTRVTSVRIDMFFIFNLSCKMSN